jgi:hypothetical protein
MHQRFQLKVLSTCVGAAVLTLSGCGGGGGSASAPALVVVPAPVVVPADPDVTFSGTAATGAPMKGAKVQLIDATGVVIETVMAADDGSYTFTVFKSSKYKAPFAVVATGTVGDTTETLVAVAAASQTAVVNVTPISHAVVATLTDGNPFILVTDPKSVAATISQARLDASEKGFHDALADNIAAAGVSGNLLSTRFDAALDKLLDNVKILVNPDGSIEISSLAGSMIDDLGATASKPAEATSATLAKGVVPTAALKASLPAPAAGSLIGISVMDTTLASINACFKLPSASRGTYAAPLGACNFKMTVAAIPYKNNGYTATQQIGSLLTSPSMDNAEFLKPEIIRQLAAGRAQIKLSWRRADGILGSLVTVAQKDTDGVWRLIGNQRDYEVNINGAVTRRQSINGTNTSRYDSGFDLYVRDDGTVSQAVITGGALPAAGVTLKHRAGCDFLSIAKPDGTTTGCSALYRLRSAKLDGSTFTPSAGSAHLYASPYMADADIATIAPGSLYKIVITSNNGVVTTYWNRLRSRPYTMAELAKVNFIDLVSTGLLTTGTIYAGGAKPTVQWKNNPLGAPANSITFFHDQGSDNSRVNFTLSSTTISCIGNLNCDGTTGNYLPIAAPSQDVIQLGARNRFDTEIFSSYMP